MSANETFTADVIRDFHFLEEEYGMRREPAAVSGGGLWLIWANANAKVIVEREIGGHCGVTVVNVRHVKRDPLDRGEFDLEEIIALSGQKQGGRRQEPRSMTEAVARAAQTLRSVGARVLGGDFEALQTKQRQRVEELRRHHPLQDHKEPEK